MTNYDPAKQPCPPLYEILPTENTLPMNGPGGTENRIENNERGILQTHLFEVIARHEYADLGSDHDSQRQGIYATNSVGDRD